MRARLAICVIALGIARCTPSAPRAVGVRPIRITVIDSRTGLPLANVPVAYAIQTVMTRGKVFGLLPPLEPDVGSKLAFVERRETNQRGQVSFSVGSLRLPRNERIDTEYAFVNVGVALDDAGARRVLNIRDSSRTREPQRYGDVPDDVYVAWFVRHHGEDFELYRNPAPEHRGALLISIDGPGGAGYQDWTRAGDPFRVQWNFSSLQKPADEVVVPLEPVTSESRR